MPRPTCVVQGAVGAKVFIVTCVNTERAENSSKVESCLIGEPFNSRFGGYILANHH